MDKKIFRVLDANFNRAKEALRVIEDTGRFIREDKTLTRKARKIRHSLTDIFKNKQTLMAMIKQRQADTDIGKPADKLELKRKNINSVVYANLQRAKESLRVLEEISKLVDKNSTAQIKRLRYECYSLEKYAHSTEPALPDHR